MTTVRGLPDNARILVIRPDRIGDVMLSTPVFGSIRAARPGWHIEALVRPLVAPLLQGHPAIDDLIVLPTDEKPSFGNTRGLAAELRKKGFDIALHLYSDFWISFAAWRAGIGIRIGPASKLARVFYNISVVQRRSKGGGHEADYNLALLEPLGIPPIRKPLIAVPQIDLGNDARMLQSGRKNVGVFPGMGGSARNWRPGQYARLVGLLQAEGWNVILMGGEADRQIVENVGGLCGMPPMKFEGGTLPRLAAFIARLNCLVGPSTGPLHIAAAVGTPAVGIYCPIRVCLPRRWGPIGGRDRALCPDVPACERCIKEACAHWDCMDRLAPESVFSAVKELL